MSRCMHSSTSYFGCSSSYLTNSSTAVSLKSLIGKTDWKSALQPLAVLRHVLVTGFQEEVVARLLHLDEVRHLRDFADVAVELANALVTGIPLEPCSRTSDLHASHPAGNGCLGCAGRFRSNACAISQIAHPDRSCVFRGTRTRVPPETHEAGPAKAAGPAVSLTQPKVAHKLTSARLPHRRRRASSGFPRPRSWRRLP